MQTRIFFLLSSVKLKHYSNTFNWYVIINKYYYMHLFSQVYREITKNEQIKLYTILYRYSRSTYLIYIANKFT
jgi:hypothetical protein